MLKTDGTPPVLSIIVPVLNEEKTIAPALWALKPFRERGAEVIVVDGGSDDATMLRARSLADQTIKAPRGRGIQMNEGAKVARGFIFLFLHADTQLPDDADTQVTVGRAPTPRSGAASMRGSQAAIRCCRWSPAS